MANEQIVNDCFEELVKLAHEKLLLAETVKGIKLDLEGEGLEKKYISKMVKAAAVKAKEKIQETKEDVKEFSDILERFA